MLNEYTGLTLNGDEVTCTLDPEKGEAQVLVEGHKHISFIFNADFPSDAKAFFEAVCTVKEIIVH